MMTRTRRWLCSVLLAFAWTQPVHADECLALLQRHSQQAEEDQKFIESKEAWARQLNAPVAWCQLYRDHAIVVTNEKMRILEAKQKCPNRFSFECDEQCKNAIANNFNDEWRRCMKETAREMFGDRSSVPESNLQSAPPQSATKPSVPAPSTSKNTQVVPGHTFAALTTFDHCKHERCYRELALGTGNTPEEARMAAVQVCKSYRSVECGLYKAFGGSKRECYFAAVIWKAGSDVEYISDASREKIAARCNNGSTSCSPIVGTCAGR